MRWALSLSVDETGSMSFSPAWTGQSSFLVDLVPSLSNSLTMVEMMASAPFTLPSCP